MTSISNEAISAYQELVTRNARYFVRKPPFPEEDDLVQEGLIKVWENLRDSVIPTSTSILNAQRDYVRMLRRQKGM